MLISSSQPRERHASTEARKVRSENGVPDMQVGAAEVWKSESGEGGGAGRSGQWVDAWGVGSEIRGRGVWIDGQSGWNKGVQNEMKNG